MARRSSAPRPSRDQPSQAVEDAFHHVLRRSLDVGVFDPQHEHAAMPAREQPVEKRRAGAADVKLARWGRRESDAGRQ
jgi:hypothetical protein